MATMVRRSVLWLLMVSFADASTVLELCKSRNFGYRIQDPEDCHSFYVCLGKWGHYNLGCGLEYRFSEAEQKCIKGKCPPCSCVKSPPDGHAMADHSLTDTSGSAEQEPTLSYNANEQNSYLETINKTAKAKVSISSAKRKPTTPVAPPNTSPYQIENVAIKNFVNNSSDVKSNYSLLNSSISTALKMNITKKLLLGKATNFDGFNFSDIPKLSSEHSNTLNTFINSTESSQIGFTSTVATILNTTTETRVDIASNTITETPEISALSVKHGNNLESVTDEITPSQMEFTTMISTNEITTQTSSNAVTEEPMTSLQVSGNSNSATDFTTPIVSTLKTTDSPVEETTFDRISIASTLKPSILKKVSIGKSINFEEPTDILDLSTRYPNSLESLTDSTASKIYFTTTTVFTTETSTQIVTTSATDSSADGFHTTSISDSTIATEVTIPTLQTIEPVEEGTNRDPISHIPSESVSKVKLLRKNLLGKAAKFENSFLSEISKLSKTHSISLESFTDSITSMGMEFTTTTLVDLESTTETTTETAINTGTELTTNPTQIATISDNTFTSTRPYINPTESTIEISTANTKDAAIEEGSTYTTSALSAESTFKINISGKLLLGKAIAFTYTTVSPPGATISGISDSTTETASTTLTPIEYTTESTTDINTQTTHSASGTITSSGLTTESATHFPQESSTHTQTADTTKISTEYTTETTELTSPTTKTSEIETAGQTTTEITTVPNTTTSDTTSESPTTFTTLVPIESTPQSTPKLTTETTRLPTETITDTTTSPDTESTTQISEQSTINTTEQPNKTTTDTGTEITTEATKESTSEITTESTTQISAESTTQSTPTTIPTTAGTSVATTEATTPTTPEGKTETTSPTTVHSTVENTANTTETNATATTVLCTLKSSTAATTCKATPTTTCSTQSAATTTSCSYRPQTVTTTTNVITPCNNQQSITPNSNNNNNVDNADINSRCANYDGVYFIKHPKVCNKYYSCYQKQAYPQTCPGHFYFDEKLQMCNYPDAVDCGREYAKLKLQSALATAKQPIPKKQQYSSLNLKPDDCSTLNSGTFIRDHTNCNKYYVCLNGYAVALYCPRGQYFDIEGYVCNFEALVKNCGS